MLLFLFTELSENCEVNVYGNIIIALGTWNNQLGNLPWNHAKNEKIEIYGDIFQQAYNNIIECDSSCKVDNTKICEDDDGKDNEKYATEEIVNYSNILYILTFALGLCALLIIMFFILSIKLFCDKCHMKERIKTLEYESILKDKMNFD